MNPLFSIFWIIRCGLVVFFTGSTAVGKIIATATAKNLVSCTLELGGKSPVIVTEDANLIVAARRILSVKAYGAGQICSESRS